MRRSEDVVIWGWPLIFAIIYCLVPILGWNPFLYAPEERQVLAGGNPMATELVTMAWYGRVTISTGLSVLVLSLTLGLARMQLARMHGSVDEEVFRVRPKKKIFVARALALAVVISAFAWIAWHELHLWGQL